MEILSKYFLKCSKNLVKLAPVDMKFKLLLVFLTIINLDHKENYCQEFLCLVSQLLLDYDSISKLSKSGNRENILRLFLSEYTRYLCLKGSILDANKILALALSKNSLQLLSISNLDSKLIIKNY